MRIGRRETGESLSNILKAVMNEGACKLHAPFYRKSALPIAERHAGGVSLFLFTASAAMAFL